MHTFKKIALVSLLSVSVAALAGCVYDEVDYDYYPPDVGQTHYVPLPPPPPIYVPQGGSHYVPLPPPQGGSHYVPLPQPAPQGGSHYAPLPPQGGSHLAPLPPTQSRNPNLAPMPIIQGPAKGFGQGGSHLAPSGMARGGTHLTPLQAN